MIGYFTSLYAGNVNVSGVLQDFDSNQFAKYQFLNNNFNGSGNFTTTDYGFFGYLGSILSRITKLWVKDIDMNGTIQMNQGNITNTTKIDATNFQINSIGAVAVSNCECRTWCANSTNVYFNATAC